MVSSECNLVHGSCRSKPRCGFYDLPHWLLWRDLLLFTSFQLHQPPCYSSNMSSVPPAEGLCSASVQEMSVPQTLLRSLPILMRLANLNFLGMLTFTIPVPVGPTGPFLRPLILLHPFLSPQHAVSLNPLHSLVLVLFRLSLLGEQLLDIRGLWFAQVLNPCLVHRGP